MKYSYLCWVVLFFGTLFSPSLIAQNDLYISLTGNDSNSGTITEPLATLTGARDKARTTGASNIYIRGGRYYFDQTTYLNSLDNGITISGYNNETVIFDGNKFVDPLSFQTVTDPNVLDRLNPAAIGNVKAVQITDPALNILLEKSTSQISINDQMQTLARFPNFGYGHIDGNTLNASVETPNTTGTPTNPKGPRFKMKESINGTKWNQELAVNDGIRTRGYLSADWLKEDNQIQSISPTGEIRLMNGTRYGLAGREGSPLRFFVYNFMYELDEPGEWFYDKNDDILYVWFKETVDTNTTVGVWAEVYCCSSYSSQFLA